jgi:hypothetical protein
MNTPLPLNDAPLAFLQKVNDRRWTKGSIPFGRCQKMNPKAASYSIKSGAAF